MPETYKDILFTIVTPSFKQGQYIEQTILSVISQAGDFSIQYIVADAGSTDETVSVLQKYDDLLKRGKYKIACKNISFQYWSRKDAGQPDALNQGFALAKGQVLAWINSDDFYEAGAFQKVAVAFRENPTADIVYGNGYTLLSASNTIRKTLTPQVTYKRLLMRGCEIFQPSAFFTASAFKKAGGIDLNLHFVFDYDLWINILRTGTALHIDEYLSYFRIWPESKTSTKAHKFIEEEKSVLKRHTTSLFGPYYFFMLKRAVKKVIFYSSLKKMFSNS